ncbi:MAG TPA: hypothetical protein VK753_00650 [Xanthomonadaceae bacterium]|nr:hypothetical protein [Xanthomonadaceae bacterium]
MLFALLLLSRVGDVLSTYLATPTLKLEANPIVRRLRWPFAIATMFVSFLAYVDTTAAVILLVPCLLICASNFGKVWMMRTMGEDAYLEMLIGVARRGNVWRAIVGILVSASFTALSGIVLMILSTETAWGYPFGMGIVIFAIVQVFYGALSYRRIFKMARKLQVAA